MTTVQDKIVPCLNSNRKNMPKEEHSILINHFRGYKKINMMYLFFVGDGHSETCSPATPRC